MEVAAGASPPVKAHAQESHQPLGKEISSHITMPATYCTFLLGCTPLATSRQLGGNKKQQQRDEDDHRGIGDIAVRRETGNDSARQGRKERDEPDEATWTKKPVGKTSAEWLPRGQ